MFLQVCLWLLSVLSLLFRWLFCLRLFLSVFLGAFTLTTFPLCAPVTRLTSLAPPRQTLFSFVFWLLGRAQTTDNGHPRLALPPSRVPTLDYVPLHPCTPMNGHHGHAWTFPTHSSVCVMLLCILTCFAMWCMVVLRECLVCLIVCFEVFPLSACPKPNPEHMCLCCCPFPGFL